MARADAAGTDNGVKAATFVLLAVMSLVVNVKQAGAFFSRDEPVVYKEKMNIYQVESRLLLGRKRLAPAVTSLTRALHENPNDIRIAVKLADLHYRARRYAESIEILRDFVDRATARRNIFYYLALNFDRLGDFRNALGYYYKALRLNPRLLKAYVRIARVRVRQGLLYDARKALERCLSIESDYFPALQERRVVDRLIRMNAENVYRKKNIVVLFPDHRLYKAVEHILPKVESTVRYLERQLKYHIPEIWLRVADRIEKHDNPPALYDYVDSAVYVRTDQLKQGRTGALVHELAYMYVRKVTRDHAPDWLLEGLALWVSRPPFLKATAIRTLDARRLDFEQKFPRDKRYLEWDRIPPGMRKKLTISFLFVKYLLDKYGWPAMRKILGAFADDTSRWDKVVWSQLHMDAQSFRRRWDMYVVSHYYFSPPAVRTRTR